MRTRPEPEADDTFDTTRNDPALARNPAAGRIPFVPETERGRLKNACNFWLQGEVAREIKAPADFYERTRDIYLLAETANDEAMLIAIQMFDDLLLEIDPPQAWFDYKKRRED